jgi:hypothetical protein
MSDRWLGIRAVDRRNAITLSRSITWQLIVLDHQARHVGYRIAVERRLIRRTPCVLRPMVLMPLTLIRIMMP